MCKHCHKQAAVDHCMAQSLEGIVPLVFYWHQSILSPSLPIPSTASYEQRRPIKVLRTISSIETRAFLTSIFLSSLSYSLYSFTHSLIAQSYRLIVHVSTCTIAVVFLPRWQRSRRLLESDGFATTSVLPVGLLFRYGMIQEGTDMVRLGLGSCASDKAYVEDLAICSYLQCR